MPPFFIDSNIAKAKTIDTDFYTQQKFYTEAKEKIFASSWQFSGGRPGPPALAPPGSDKRNPAAAPAAASPVHRVA